MKVPLTTVKSPEEVTGVRSPDPESWTVPLEIGKGLHWMDGKTPGKIEHEFILHIHSVQKYLDFFFLLTDKSKITITKPSPLLYICPVSLKRKQFL